MSDSTTNLFPPYILAAQAQKHVTHNEALRLLDGLVQLSVLDRDFTAPPSSPADGDRYIVATGATGDWDLSVALWTDGAWLWLPPRTGWRAWVEDEAILLTYDGFGWMNLGGTAGADGDSAYDIWLAEGNTGTEADFLAALVSPAGSTGPTCPAGPAGADGADGTSVTILGSLISTGDLPGTGNSPGDGYIISGDLHVWDGSQWNNVGPIRGRRVIPGLRAPMGRTAPRHARSGSMTGIPGRRAIFSSRWWGRKAQPVQKARRARLGQPAPMAMMAPTG